MLWPASKQSHGLWQMVWPATLFLLIASSRDFVPRDCPAKRFLRPLSSSRPYRQEYSFHQKYLFRGIFPAVDQSCIWWGSHSAFTWHNFHHPRRRHVPYPSARRAKVYDLSSAIYPPPYPPLSPIHIQLCLSRLSLCCMPTGLLWISSLAVCDI